MLSPKNNHFTEEGIFVSFSSSSKGNHISHNALKLFIFGIVIGISSITPGLSGGILAIALGVYAPTLSAVHALGRDFKKSVSFLFPLGLGALLGLFLFGLIMKPLLAQYTESVICLFSGLILGSLPSVFKEAHKDGFRPLFLLPMLAAFFLGLLSSRAAADAAGDLASSFLLYIIGGGIFSLGLIVPGISSSFILIEMGLYADILSAFTALDFSVLLPVALGVAVFLLLFLHVIHLAFSKWHGYAYYAALGFLFSTLFTVFPGLHSFLDGILLLLGAVGVYLFMRHASSISSDI